MRIRMSPAEIDLFTSFVEKSNGYFEFGIGGSTFYASQVVRGPVRAVDSDIQWIKNAKDSIPISPFERDLIYVDIGETKEWGYPVSDESRDRFPAYHEAIVTKAGDIDLCLVDGRFRVACFYQALLNLPMGAIIGFHDYRSRPHYHVVEEFARPIAEKGDMSFFVHRSGIYPGSLEKALAKMSYNPA
jgi:hypothetical protein